MTIPVDSEKVAKIAFNISMSLLEPSENKRISSTKSRCEMQILSPILIPLSKPFDLACEIALLRPTTTKMKIRGAKGQPSLSTLQGLIKQEIDPLI